ncbi:hypothetical protein PPTG_04635 [Phytophthora nicotianae INRA-310]|uniref:START domain-containing protein n=1 Tax=Phytophthora nicotianae (strain INRA-310) TaxID=761204 RepID=W2R1I8_PHYN3|nr:hypothetical protein PPTG_04635 [Phytophthora nicotianae INRA-310]ETN19277.1 hypothetical protein PPTG_04635 [Phytophthora nicotianae INRA-310]
MTPDGRREVPFAPLNLTLDQQQLCQDLTFQLLDRTLRSYDERDACRNPLSGSPRHHANLDSTRWKQLRTQTNASLYSERTSNTCTPRDLHLPGDIWENPCVLLAVGTIESNLSEVMFGLEIPDFLAMQVRSETLGKQPLDGAVLAQLAGPTEADPFQFMGITWMVGEQSWPLNKVVRPRDFVIVTATGVVSRPNGERIGYEVVQSIDLPQCPALPKPMIRGKLMYGAIYRQFEKGAVDVYIQMYVEPQGRLVDKVVIAAMWESTLGFWNSPQLSETKKLQWCIENKSIKRREQASELAQSGKVEPSTCGNCLKKRSMLSRRRSTHPGDDNTCALCATPLCWSCRVKKTFKSRGRHSAKLVDMEIAVCKACILFAQKQYPATIAMHNQKQRRAVL